jgi:uridine phosphorylase
MTDRFLTPDRLMAARFPDAAALPRWELAVLCFRDRRGSHALVAALDGVPVGRKIFWGLEETDELPHVYTADVNGRSVGIIARCVWGGPQAAILVEELAALGVTCVLGYGAAASLDPTLPHGAQLLISSALATDGASRHYGDGPFGPADDMAALATSAIPVVAATVDAIYRETPQLVEQFTRAGARVLNMEAAPFYAAASACGLRAVWLGHVSDLLVGEWQDWYVDRDAMNNGTITNCLAVICGVEIARGEAVR